MVTNEGLIRFKELYFQRYGINLNETEVHEKANQLLNLYRTIFKEPININIKHEQEIRGKEN